MNYWLVKSEPTVYSWEDFIKDKRTTWDGVRNFQARNNLRAMKKGDLVLWYHSNEGKEIVGIAKVIKESYPDPTTDDLNWVVVDLSPFKKLKIPVSLERIKNEKNLMEMGFLRQGRLSVVSITSSEFEQIIYMSENKK